MFIPSTIVSVYLQSLIGTLPDSLYSMTTLEAIDLNDNQLSGTISNDIGKLSQLVVVQLDGNNFTGTWPFL